MEPDTLPAEDIGARILFVRAHKVMLDSDLAALYGVPTGVLVQAVRRNIERFPQDFMFQLTEQELRNLKSQIVISSSGDTGKWGGRRTLPYAFTEQGVAMLSSVLRSRRAIAVNIAIMRAFVRLREMVAADAELAKKLDELERRVADHDDAIASVVRAIRELMTPPQPKPKRRIGFIHD
jgi:ORF6N domain-containing protein